MAATEAKNVDSRGKIQQRKRCGWHRFIYLEPALFFFSVGDFMNYAIQPQYVYYRIAKELGLSVEYMTESRGGCPTRNSTNSTLLDIESKVEYILRLLLQVFTLSFCYFVVSVLFCCRLNSPFLMLSTVRSSIITSLRKRRYSHFTTLWLACLLGKNSCERGKHIIS